MPDRRIDVHAHIVPAFLVDAAGEAGFGASISSGFPKWSPEMALQFMDGNDIATTIASVSQPGVHYGDDLKARALARRCNELMADLASRHPKRFGAFAAVPMPDVKGALDEIAYALDVLRLDAVGLLASYGTSFLGDPKFDPVLELLNERRAIVFIHPNYHPSSKALGMDLPGFLIEFTFDTTRAVANLIFRGALERFPHIKFVLAHNGGVIPFLSWRMAMAPLIDKRFQSFSRAGIVAAIRSFYYDTAQCAGPAPIAAMKEIADPTRILMGTDWPYCPPSVTEAGDAALKAQGATFAADVFRNNAVRLFPRFT
jgi:predicted TIM-barrel fold metal-dependent hydrolase